MHGYSILQLAYLACYSASSLYAAVTACSALSPAVNCIDLRRGRFLEPLSGVRFLHEVIVDAWNWWQRGKQRRVVSRFHGIQEVLSSRFECDEGVNTTLQAIVIQAIVVQEWRGPSQVRRPVEDSAQQPLVLRAEIISYTRLERKIYD